MVDNSSEWEKVHKEEKRPITSFEHFCGRWHIGGYTVIDLNMLSATVLRKTISMRVPCQSVPLLTSKMIKQDY